MISFISLLTQISIIKQDNHFRTMNSRMPGITPNHLMLLLVPSSSSVERGALSTEASITIQFIIIHHPSTH